MQYKLGERQQNLPPTPCHSGDGPNGEPVERRRFARIKLNAPIRLLNENGVECRGTLLHLSPGTLTIHCVAPIGLDDNIVVYLADVDRFQGVVTKRAGRVFSMDLQISAARRELLVETLIVELAKRDHVLDKAEFSPNRRRAPRQQALSKQSLCTLSGGRSFSCSIVDMSVFGIGIEIKEELQLGETVRIGKTMAVVSRKTEIGYGLEIVGSEPLQKNNGKVFTALQKFLQTTPVKPERFENERISALT